MVKKSELNIQSTLFQSISSNNSYSELLREEPEIEKERVNKNPYCSKCSYLGSCLSEHLRDVKDLTYSCNGFKHLLDWYNERF